ncbi:23S rRNA (guanosine(2251)-2'-O)-methyltransferase RlmB [Candidatus Profftia sp. (ex Adelges kitamiensis)]|uniref:23S rRNA (guanosine(2251)-2'-O)-methyltransferase RlmB n=1 Tax=Candidatus Profftia sp. (ex Adelges kitamiensis) TaxID=2864218 RepID=UPI001CE2B659|nr:23S rRNA (guanosine(2251)-2'-O)-methyltransferase RlmB [Candidatus Profftia sp. (ex Adelges kitamiensis)]
MSEIIYGIHAIKVLLKRDPKSFIEVFVTSGHKDCSLMLIIAEIERIGILIHFVRRYELNVKVNSAVHQGIVAHIHIRNHYQEKDLPKILENLKKPPFLLILDGVTDPHNLGACLRSADAAGIHIVIIPRNRSVQLNATVQKVACGAAATVPVISVTNLTRTMRLLQDKNVWIVGTMINADYDLYQSNITNQMGLAFVMGSEGNGMRRLTREHCNELVSIPMNGSVSSLNVSVATGICLFEAVRRRG